MADPPETERVRRRVRLLIEITATSGVYRKGLEAAARLMGPEEATILTDLERNGLQVPQLRDILCGGHVLVDDPDLYDAWNFEGRSHQRISSHHRHIDKQEYPDLGMRGPVVREKLHGRTALGTWVQLEKTPATMGSRKLPSMSDLMHLVDYLVYRVTRSNVGPWGRSKVTERRPLYLSPDVAVTTSLDPVVAEDLARTFSRIEESDDTTSASSDLAARFPPPDRVDDLLEIGPAATGHRTLGLFGNSEVWVTEMPSGPAVAVLRERATPPRWELPDVYAASPRTLRADGRVITVADRRHPGAAPSRTIGGPP